MAADLVLFEKVTFGSGRSIVCNSVTGKPAYDRASGFCCATPMGQKADKLYIRSAINE